MATKILEEMFVKIGEPPKTCNYKITIVGAGMVGMACAIAILNRKLTDELCLIDINSDLLEGELLDLQQGSMYLHSAKLVAGTDYKLSAGSRICVITAGVRGKDDDSSLLLVQQNTDIIKTIVPKLVKHSPDTIILMVSEPVDILTFVAWKISGLPVNRVIGTGTSIDTARFRYMLAERLKVAPTDVHGWIIGEHGDSAVPVWSSVSIGGVRLREVNPKIGAPDDPQKFNEITTDLPKMAYVVRKRKGGSNWSIGICVAEICSHIINNSETVISVSTHVKGTQGIEKDIFLSLPCVINANGIKSIVKQNLTREEQDLLKKSSCVLCEVQNKVTV